MDEINLLCEEEIRAKKLEKVIASAFRDQNVYLEN
jgi:hypothetical protein